MTKYQAWSGQSSDSNAIALSSPRLAEPVAVRDPLSDYIYAVIDTRRLERECFVRSIELLHKKIVLFSYSSVDDFFSRHDRAPKLGVVIYNVGSKSISDPDTTANLQSLTARSESLPVVVLGDAEDVSEAIAAVDCGACGYIMASIGIDAIIEACKLAAAGGIVLPRSCLEALRSVVQTPVEASPNFGQNLTWRQSAVADALRQGKANKIIAYELNMCESTVKVHIRNIMKKLQAKNRTEAAFKLNSVFIDERRR